MLVEECFRFQALWLLVCLVGICWCRLTTECSAISLGMHFELHLGFFARLRGHILLIIQFLAVGLACLVWIVQVFIPLLVFIKRQSQCGGLLVFGIHWSYDFEGMNARGSGARIIVRGNVRPGPLHDTFPVDVVVEGLLVEQTRLAPGPAGAVVQATDREALPWGRIVWLLPSLRLPFRLDSHRKVGQFGHGQAEHNVHVSREAVAQQCLDKTN